MLSNTACSLPPGEWAVSFGTIENVDAELHAQMARSSSHDDDVARERGRLFAARAIIENPEQRKVAEAIYGVAYCANRWPEAYTVNTKTGGWREVLKWIPRMTDILESNR